jgi:phosphoserine aminotransferase
MTKSRIHNFSAGPAVLPECVVTELQEQLPNLHNSGVGLMEISHRSETFEAIAHSANKRLRRLLALPDDYEVLMLQGGASLQFCMVAMNLLQGGVADYIDTGTWSKKALVEAKRFGDAKSVWSGEATDYRAVPKDSEWTCSTDAVYTHYTSNNTIYGTQFHVPPKGEHLVVDMSSDIVSTQIKGSDYDLIYAGAQKNMGPSGVTVVALSPWAAERADPDLPSMLRYKLHIEKNSMFNTPNTLGVFTLDCVLSWIEEQGLDKVAETNRRKAAKIYKVIDDSDFWVGRAEVDSRSIMNVTWDLRDTRLQQRLLDKAATAGFNGIRGHRSVGGLRASIYNACPETSVDALVEFLKEFERTEG